MLKGCNFHGQLDSTTKGKKKKYGYFKLNTKKPTIFLQKEWIQGK